MAFLEEVVKLKQHNGKFPYCSFGDTRLEIIEKLNAYFFKSRTASHKFRYRDTGGKNVIVFGLLYMKSYSYANNVSFVFRE